MEKETVKIQDTIRIDNEQKIWNDLAKTNSKFFIYSDKGEDISNEKYRISGKEHYDEFITTDNSLKLKKEEFIFANPN